jgi:PEP-CTERM motif-containing protein
MLKSLSAKLSIAVLFSAFIVPAHAVQVLTNGTFDTGVTGWTSFVTANGTITDPPSPPAGPPTSEQATTRSFNVTGSGASDALFLNAGGKSFTGTQQGGGVTQTFSTMGGVATFSADIAAWTRANSLGIGLLSVLLDGVLMDSHDFGNADGSNGTITLRSTLGFTTDLAAGSHTLTLLATRGFAHASGVTNQYFDNASLDVAQTPLPAALPMFISGLGVVGALWRRNKKKAQAASAAA